MSLIFYSATTLDGFIADPDDSLDWLLRQDIDESGAGNYRDFYAGVGALVMGRTTYQWVLDHIGRTGEEWFYAEPTWVMTHQGDLAKPAGADVRFTSAPLPEVLAEMTAAAGEKDVWVVGGGDLAGQFADLGLLDEVILQYAPVTLGAGRPLLPRRLDLELIETGRNRAFVTARWRVQGPLTEDR